MSTNNQQPSNDPFTLEDVVHEIRAMAHVCDEHMLGVRPMLPWQQPFKREELERRKKCYQAAAQLLTDLIKEHRIVIG